MKNSISGMTSTSILIRRERLFKLFAFLALLCLGGVVLLAIDNMLLSFVLAIVISYLFAPVVVITERAQVPRGLAVALLFVIVGVVLGALGYLLFPLIAEQFAKLRVELPSYIEGTKKLIEQWESHLRVLAPLREINLSDRVESYLSAKGNDFFEVLPQLVSQIFTVLLLAPFFAFFMLVDGRTISRHILALVPNNVFELALNLNHQINDQIGGYIRARLLESAIVSLVIWVGLSLFSFPYAFLLALLAGITNLIPYIGPIIGAVPAVLIALIQIQDPISLFLVGSVYGLAQIIDIAFVIPLVVAKIVNLHPVTVVVVIIIGSQIMGVLGMIISIPVASLIKVTISSVYKHLIQSHS